MYEKNAEWKIIQKKGNGKWREVEKNFAKKDNGKWKPHKWEKKEKVIWKLRWNQPKSVWRPKKSQVFWCVDLVSAYTIDIIHATNSFHGKAKIRQKTGFCRFFFWFLTLLRFQACPQSHQYFIHSPFFSIAQIPVFCYERAFFVRSFVIRFCLWLKIGCLDELIWWTNM